MNNTTSATLKAPMHPRQLRALCSSQHTQWDTNGLYSSTVYLVTYPCTGDATIPVLQTPTPAAIEALPQSPSAMPTPTEVSTSSQTDTPSNAWPAGAIALAVCLGLALAAALAAIIFIACRGRKQAASVAPSEKADGESTASNSTYHTASDSSSGRVRF